MRPGYLAALLVDLLPRTGRGDIKGAELWRGPGGGEHECGLMVQFGDGALLGFKVVGASPVGGHPSGPDDYSRAERPSGDVSSVLAGGAGAAAMCTYLAVLLDASGHADIARVEASSVGGPSVLVVDGAGFHLHVLPARAVGPGGRRLPDWKPADWGVMA